MTKHNRPKLIFLIVLIFLFGCQSSPSQPTETLAPTPAPVPASVENVVTPRRDGTLKISSRLPKTLNPLLNEDITVDKVLRLMFEPLLELNENCEPTPVLAESFEFAPDGMSVQVVMRDGITWWDGREVTAADVIYSLNVLKSAPEQAVYKHILRDVSGFTASGNTVRINFTRRVGFYPYMLCFPVIPQHHYNQKKASDTDFNPLGSGLYKFGEYGNVRELHLVASNGMFRQKPLIESIDVLITPDGETELHSFAQGLIDETVATMSEWGKYSRTKKTSITEYINTTYDFIGFNFKHWALGDLQVRKAVAHATDMRLIVDSVYLNHAAAARSTVSPASWLYDPNTAVYEYNMETARLILEQTGFFTYTDGLIYKEYNGVVYDLRCRILVNEENSERVKIAEIMRDNLSELGMICEIESLAFDEYVQKLTAKDFDIVIGSFLLSADPNPSFAFHSSNIESGKNYFSYRSDTMDALLSSLPTLADAANYKRAFSEYQKLFAEDLPCVSLVFRKSAVLTDADIHGEIHPTIDNVFHNINEWFIAE